jgi:hypothetical protein
MQFWPNPRSRRLAVRGLGSLALLGAFAVAIFFTLPEPVEKPVTDENAAVDVALSRRCEDDLADILEAMSPGRLGISSDRAELVNRLNAWHSECGSPAGAVRPSSDEALLARLLQGETLARTKSERYLPEDASHVRGSLLGRDIVTYVTEGKSSNIERYVSLFEFVSGNVGLVPASVRDAFPLTVYEALLFGFGSDADRAWVYADLLRQMRVDVVILVPRGKNAENWLLGVIDSRAGVLLFDPRLGIPIPAATSSDETPFPQTPATLSEARESDACFRKLDLPGDPYPLSKADITELDVKLIGTSSTWAPRMAELQFLLPKGYHVDLYDGLGTNELRAPGLLQRIINAGQKNLWKEQDVSIWSFPEAQLSAIEASRGAGAEGSPLANFLFVFRGPYIPRLEGDGQTRMAPIDKSLHFVRTEQLRGNFVAATRDLLPIRSAAKLASTPPNELASQYAALWTGISQYATHKPAAAFNTFRRFVESQNPSPALSRSAMEWAAQCLIAEKQILPAAQLLTQMPQGFTPRRDQYLIRRWKKIAGVDPDQPLESPSQTPSPGAENSKQPAAETGKMEPKSPTPPGTPPVPASSSRTPSLRPPVPELPVPIENSSPSKAE